MDTSLLARLLSAARTVTPLAPKVARRGSRWLAVEEGHGAEVSLRGGRWPVP